MAFNFYHQLLQHRPVQGSPWRKRDEEAAEMQKKKALSLQEGQREDQQPLAEGESDEGCRAFCRICYEGDDGASELVSPCQCKGSLKYVHLDCLARWRRTKVNPKAANMCENCLHAYTFVEPAYAKYFKGILFRAFLSLALALCLALLLGVACQAMQRMAMPDVELDNCLEDWNISVLCTGGVVLGILGFVSFGLGVGVVNPLVLTRANDGTQSWSECAVLTLIISVGILRALYLVWKLNTRIIGSFFADTSNMVVQRKGTRQRHER